MTFEPLPYVVYDVSEPKPYLGTFISPRHDYGFKRIFDKQQLLSLLNSVLPVDETIHDLSFLLQEDVPETHEGKRLIYDILCETDQGERIIVKMQNQPHINLGEQMSVYDCRQLLSQLSTKDKKYTDVKSFLNGLRPIQFRHAKGLNDLNSNAGVALEKSHLSAFILKRHSTTLNP